MAVIPLFESDESDEAELYEFESDESDEAARPRGRRMGGPIRTPGRGNNVPTRPQQGFATRTELMATAKRIDDKIATLSTGVKALDGRVRTIDTDIGKLRADLKKESAARSNINGQLNNVMQMSMLLPLLSTQTTRKVSTANGELKADDKVVVDSGDSFTKILPILLMSGGLGGGAQSPQQGGAFGGDNGMMMALVVAMAVGNK
jgi:uncharacterized small protein (DUF1192 family)